MAEIEIENERIDDIPLLVGQQEKMGIGQVVDEAIAGHGNRRGLSIGQTVMGWLAFIVSESDHRLSFVEPWAAQRLSTLRRLLGQEMSSKAFNDDRLGDVLRYLSDDASWEAIEKQLGQRLLRVYQLPLVQLRLDTTSVAVYHEPEGTTLIRRGYSKDHRPDLAQLKVMLAGLDPLGLPLVTQVIPGNVADDGLYVPAIEQARAVTQQRGLLYIGDQKMEALATRAHLAAGGDYYLLPLRDRGKQAPLLAALLQPVWDGVQTLSDVYRDDPQSGEQTLIAQGYETTRRPEALYNGEMVRWVERLLVLYSPSLAQRAYQSFEERLQRAEEKLMALTPPPRRGKRQYEELASLQQAAQAVLRQQQVVGLLQLDYERQVTQRQLRRYRDQPARTEEKIRYQLHITRDEAAIAALYRSLGWRLYATNAPAASLPLAQAVLAYRGAPNIERDFSRLKGRPLGLRPVYLQREDHLKGLVRLLSLALSLLTVTEFVARRALLTVNESLTSLYPGNPKQRTSRPTAERLLAAFKELTLTVVHLPGQVVVHITPLSPLQQRILELLDLPSSIYADLAATAHPNPP